MRDLSRALLPYYGAGLEYPADAYEVLGALKVLAEGLPQASGQLAAFLVREVEAGRVQAVEGQPYAGDPQAAVAVAEHWLAQAKALAGQLREVWSQAQIAIAGLAAAGDRD